MLKYTKPREEEDDQPVAVTNLIAGQYARTNPASRRRKMTDAEVMQRLRTIVTMGDPDRKYQKLEKIGSG